MGGPILSLDNSIVYGILSQVSQSGCGLGTTATRVSSYLDWIETNSGVTP